MTNVHESHSNHRVCIPPVHCAQLAPAPGEAGDEREGGDERRWR